MTARTIPDKASRREWIGLAVIALPCMLYSMDLTVLNLAVPSLSADLKPSGTQLLWIVDIYGFMVAGLLITMGTLGDRIGRRRLLMFGASFFGIASVLAAFSRSAEMLIAMRALLGVAGATLAPSTLSLIRNMFRDDRERTVAIGVWIASYSAGAAIGPLVGGLLLSYFWWGSVFLVSVPVMVLLLALAPLLLPEFRDPQACRLDVLSAAMSLAAVMTTIFGLKRLAEDGWSILSLASIAAGIVIGVLFVRRQSALADPLIDLRLFRSRAFSASLVTYTMGCFVMFGASLFIAQYLQLVLDLPPMQAGLWTLPWALAFILGSVLTPIVVRRFAKSTVVAGALVVAAFGFGLLTRAGAVDGLAMIVAGSIFLSLGLAPVFTLATDLVVAAAPPERAGAASAISETSSEFGGAMGIAIFGTIGAAVYRHAMSTTLPPGVPPDLALAAQGTLGAAVDVASRLPAAAGAALLAASRNAFVGSMQLSVAVAAALLLATAVLAAVGLRSPKKPVGDVVDPSPKQKST